MPPWRVAVAEKAAAGDRPLVIALVGLIGLLLGLPMYLINDEVDEIDDKVGALEGKIDAKFAEQDEKIDAKFAAVDAKFAEQDDDLDEIKLKLTALIAALNATDEVDAALEGRLLNPDTGDTEPGSNPAR